MRDQDPEDVKKVYAERRLLKSVYGMVVSLVGFAILFWLPAPEWLRHVTGWGVILYGGMYVDPSVPGEWKKLIGKDLPFLSGGSDE